MAAQPDDYAAGRRDALQKIRDLLIDDVDKFARVVVGDYAGMGAKKQALNPFVQIAKAVTRANLNCLRAAIDDLEGGASVYAITGVSAIPTYRPITGGDYSAGVLSAVEDMTVLLGTINGQEIFKPFQNSQKSLSDLAEDNEIQMPQMFSYNHSLLIDGFYVRMQEHIVSKITPPQMIAYEGGAAQPEVKTLAQRFKNALLNQQYPLDRFARRAAKMPTLWPPLHSRESVVLTPHQDMAVIADYNPDQNLDMVNDHPDYAAGFMQGLKALYDGLQDYHFDQMGKAGGYAGNLGHDFSWSKKVNSTAMNEFGPLRDAIRQQMQERQAYGLGASHQEGLQGALSWVLQNIAQRAPNVGSAENVQDITRTNSLECILPAWVHQAKSIIEQVINQKDASLWPAPAKCVP